MDQDLDPAFIDELCEYVKLDDAEIEEDVVDRDEEEEDDGEEEEEEEDGEEDEDPSMIDQSIEACARRVNTSLETLQASEDFNWLLTTKKAPRNQQDQRLYAFFKSWALANNVLAASTNPESSSSSSVPRNRRRKDPGVRIDPGAKGLGFWTYAFLRNLGFNSIRIKSQVELALRHFVLSKLTNHSQAIVAWEFWDELKLLKAVVHDQSLLCECRMTQLFAMPAKYQPTLYQKMVAAKVDPLFDEFYRNNIYVMYVDRIIHNWLHGAMSLPSVNCEVDESLHGALLMAAVNICNESELIRFCKELLGDTSEERKVLIQKAYIKQLKYKDCMGDAEYQMVCEYLL